MLAPTLLVGLGGTGSKIVCKVYEMANKEQKEKLGFAVFDTDINELKDIKDAYPFVKTVQTSTRLTVGEYLQIDKNASRTWFPNNTILNSKTLTEGAGQVRAVSRLALETAIRAGKMEPLHEAVQDLYKLEEGKGEQSLRVIIVGSLAGGTGSGLLLPVALYIKNYLATRFRQGSNITRGFFILPEVFYEVIKGQSERNNLKSNAYAALRELDAFLMKGDKTLHEKYNNSVVVQFPVAGSDGYDEYDVRPYDFCFLFDAQNAKGETLNSFKAYINHAAECVFAQSIGPMNKRSNSSEDNVIRKLVAERGRNRYAGAGASILKYPVDDVKEYIALNWAKSCVSDEWLQYDTLYKDLVKKNEKQRREGLSVEDIDRAKNYRTTVDTKAKEGKAFSKNIINSCMVFEENGRTVKERKWETYVEALVEKIEMDQSYGNDDLDRIKDDAKKAVARIEGGDEAWINIDVAYDTIQTYEHRVKQQVEENANTIAYTMFKTQEDDDLGFRLETHLKDNKRNYIHPNATRYMLYKVLESLEERIDDVQSVTEKSRKYVNSFEQIHKKDPDSGEIVSFEKAKGKGTIIEGLRGKLSAEQENLIVEFGKYIGHIDKIRVNDVLIQVLQAGVKYINDLSESFEKFYDALDEKIKTIDRRISEIEKKFGSAKGSAIRFVCANDVCLKMMNDRFTYTGGSINLKGGLTSKIYKRNQAYAEQDPKPSNNSFFSKIFDDDILGYFKEELTSVYKEQVEVDVIEALRCEAIYNAAPKVLDDDEIWKHVEETIAKTRELSTPFIERPIGTDTQPIDACAFNKDLRPNDESIRAQIVDRELANYGGIGVRDEEISKQMVLFYRSFYGLRATDLSKFAPPDKSPTANGGDYYKAYFDLIKDIHPIPDQSRALSPHVDRWWHIASKMPDLDERNQEMQEQRINAAFFWMLVAGFLEYEKSSETKMYLLRSEKLGLDSEQLVVSNGTECDCLYEVQDALSIYPKLVDTVLNKVEQIVTDDVSIFSGSNVLDNATLYKAIKNFRVQEFELGEDNLVRSVLEIPILMKKSVAPDLYYEEAVIDKLRSILNEVKKYIARFCTENDLPVIYARFLREQIELYVSNLVKESKDSHFEYFGSLFRKTLDIIAGVFDEYKMQENVDFVEGLKKKHKK